MYTGVTTRRIIVVDFGHRSVTVLLLLDSDCEYVCIDFVDVCSLSDCGIPGSRRRFVGLVQELLLLVKLYSSWKCLIFLQSNIKVHKEICTRSEVSGDFMGFLFISNNF